MNAMYDQIGELFDFSVDEASERLVEINSFRQMVGNVKDKRVMDLACGSGFFSRLLVDLGASSVLGVDISQQMIDVAQAKNDRQDVLAFEVHDVLQMPTRDAFDLVTAVWLLCYARDEAELTAMLGKIHDQLKPGGALVAYTSNPAFDLQVSNFTRYGLTILAEYPVPGGRRCAAEFVASPPVPFEFFRLDRAVYERAIRQAGFSRFEWVTPAIPSQALERFGEAYWHDFRENCDQIGLICHR
ncbi:class I SAM-dependent methyltransferase [Pseudomonas monteilii]|uniref:class I SAM-dependent methyltransferase n=1 Tax=Pseudomonas alabamensis TaxID=3064349 RepID=UPI002712B020|nr:class I SAM-dependent methyltransferase [Pseudomonas sp. 22-AL-CL-001]MDO7910068.1 class I SAM-dependent methyltransferase [Pseudomonas sp. 22-AL-CL-001]